MWNGGGEDAVTEPSRICMTVMPCNCLRAYMYGIRSAWHRADQITGRPKPKTILHLNKAAAVYQSILLVQGAWHFPQLVDTLTNQTMPR